MTETGNDRIPTDTLTTAGNVIVRQQQAVACRCVVMIMCRLNVITVILTATPDAIYHVIKQRHRDNNVWRCSVTYAGYNVISNDVIVMPLNQHCLTNVVNSHNAINNNHSGAFLLH